MSNTISTEETLVAAKAHFISAYKRILAEKLRTELEEEGDLDSVKDGEYLSGSFLNGVDEEAYTETMSEYAWRMGGSRDEIHETLQDPDMYGDVDYDAIVAEVEKV